MGGWREESSHSGSGAYREAASRNPDRAGGRWPWELATAKVADGNPIRTRSGDVMRGPTEVGPIPNAPKENLAARSSFPVLDPGQDNNQDGQRADFSRHPSTPKRMGSPPNAPPPQLRKVTEQGEGQRGGRVLAEKHGVGEPGSGLMETITDKSVGPRGGIPPYGLARAQGSVSDGDATGVPEGPCPPPRQLEKPSGAPWLEQGREFGSVDAGLACGGRHPCLTAHFPEIGCE